MIQQPANIFLHVMCLKVSVEGTLCITVGSSRYLFFRRNRLQVSSASRSLYLIQICKFGFQFQFSSQPLYCVVLEQIYMWYICGPVASERCSCCALRLVSQGDRDGLKLFDCPTESCVSECTSNAGISKVAVVTMVKNMVSQIVFTISHWYLDFGVSSFSDGLVLNLRHK